MAGLLIFSLIFSPLARASWDLWAQTALHLAAVALILTGLWKLFRKRGLPLLPSDVRMASLLLLGWNILSTLFSSYPHQAIMETLNLANGLLIFFLASGGALSWEKGRALLGILVFILVITAATTELPMVNPNVLAGYLAACSLGMLDGAFEGSLKIETARQERSPRGEATGGSPAEGEVRQRRPETTSSYKRRILFGIGLFFCALGIFLARSFGGFLAASVGAAFWFGKRYPRVRASLLGGMCLIALAAGALKLGSAGGANRILWWKTAIRMTQAHPVLGVGPGGYEHAYLYFRPAKGLNTIYPHSEPLRAASETGIVGFALWATLLGLIFRRGIENKAWGCLGLLTALLFHNLYDYSLSIFACQILFWAAAGWAIHEERRTRKFQLLSPQAAKACFVLGGLFCLGVAMQITKIFLANRHTAKGEIALAEKRVVEAKAHFEKAIGLWPLNPQDYIGLAKIHTGPPEESLEIRKFLEEVKALDRYGLSLKDAP